MWCTRNGSDVQLTSPYTFTSGETVHVRPKVVPAAAIGDWYKLPLLIQASAYPTLQQYVEVVITSNL